MDNADIDHMNVLADPPEISMIDDEAYLPLPLTTEQTLLPKIEQGLILLSSSWPSCCYPTCIRHPPKCYGFDQQHIFTTVVDDIQTSYLYVDASGNTVDLAFDDKNTIAQVCHYVMLHCVESTYFGNPNNKK